MVNPPMASGGSLDWTGFYVGVSGGWAFSEGDSDYSYDGAMRSIE